MSLLVSKFIFILYCTSDSAPSIIRRRFWFLWYIICKLERSIDWSEDFCLFGGFEFLKWFHHFIFGGFVLLGRHVEVFWIHCLIFKIIFGFFKLQMFCLENLKFSFVNSHEETIVQKMPLKKFSQKIWWLFIKVIRFDRIQDKFSNFFNRNFWSNFFYMSCKSFWL